MTVQKIKIFHSSPVRCIVVSHPPPFAVETPTATYIFHVDACSPFFGETLFLPLFSDSALSLAFSECFIFAILLHDNSPVSTFNTC